MAQPNLWPVLHTVDTASAYKAGLSIRDVSLTYGTSRGPLRALDNLSLDVKPGEFVAVLGPSGCGKSTLLKLVSGLLSATEGEIHLKGRPVKSPRSDVGIVFQQATLLPWKTVLNNVLVPVRAMGLPVKNYRDKALDLLKLVGLEAFANHYPSELSGGMQQRVAVARGLIHDPALLLMDEPFAALDAMTREHMMIELQRIWASTHKSVLFITHSIQEAVFLADRVLIMGGRPGRVVDELVVPLERPRTVETMARKDFNDLLGHLRHVFGEKSTC
ncbi:ABC transporter ATP-binding protein [Microvirga rosea]|uniref:ABC transporter ATP-binding protein n=1 Tax=Microvirga rosea TaxID=2715425 RepID=UPI001D0A7119|nr:ABC transporter ATP-binding protein [Microvirga rosea]MCB8823195.1 ABC transporter ATP-binding protein [Microvirga rosea]